MINIDSRLINDCEVLGKFKLCHVLLMRDANYPWCVLVPDREGMSEVFDLCEEDQNQLQLESSTLLAFLKNEFKADKMNVAALGNVVAQLHIHHIVRYKKDIAWPSPVWGTFPAKPYIESELKKRINCLVEGFKSLNIGFESNISS
jgi:diadenosine tetraphosphate (Ap4A) HIT family hydrolase